MVEPIVVDNIMHKCIHACMPNHTKCLMNFLDIIKYNSARLFLEKLAGLKSG